MTKKKIKIQIISRLNGSVLFEYESLDNTIKETLEKAVNKDANLRGADLRGANLWDANLRGANLRGADLRGVNGLDIWWHIHHDILYEQLTEPVRKRINFIKENKPKNEVALRLELLKPVLGKFPKTQKGWETLHKKECKDCPWNGETIFPEKDKE